MARLAKAVMQPRTWEHFEQTNEADFAYSIETWDASASTPIGRGHGRYGLPAGASARSFGELGLPEVLGRSPTNRAGWCS